MLWPFKRIKITGHSMEPLLRDGDFLLVNQWAYIFFRPKIEDIVVFKNPQNKNQLLCKRIAEIQGVNYILLGDNHSDTLDSSQLGPIPRRLILGRVLT